MMTYSDTHRSSRPMMRRTVNVSAAGYDSRSALRLWTPRIRSPDCGHSTTTSSW